MELSHQPCPIEGCGSSDAFSFNPEKGTGYCHSCGKGYPNKHEEDWARDTYPVPDLNTGSTQQRMELSEPDHVRTFTDFRGISEDTSKFYNVPTLLDGEGVPTRRVYTYPSGGTKTRVLPKTFFVSNFKSDELFGMDLFPAGSSKFVTITEGEEDAMSVSQMTSKNGERYPVVSVPSATLSKRFWQGAAKEWLDSFEKIILSFDNDSAGKEAVETFGRIFPNKVYVMDHGNYKDANEFLQSGNSALFRKYWWAAQKFVPENVFNTPDQFLGIYRENDDSQYIPTNIKGLDNLLLGLMQGHFTVIQAEEGIGKTEVMRYLEYNFLSKYPEISFAVCHLEEPKKRGILGLVSYDLKDNLTRKDLIDVKGRHQDVENSIINLTKNENLFQFSMATDEDPFSMLEKIRYFKEACGCQYVFFEPIQDLAYSKQSDDTIESVLTKLSTLLARLAAEINVGIVTIAHENDDGAIRDCRMIGKRASVVIRLERDKLATDEETRNTTKCVVLKNRPAAVTGHGGLLEFDQETFTLQEKLMD